MKYSYLLITPFILFGCSEVADNPTAASNFQTVPNEVLQTIDNYCAFCHLPESSVIFKGQKPYFRNLHPDGTTFLDTLQIWQSKERIGFRVKEGTMPRISDTSNVFSPLPAINYDILVQWAESEE